MTTINEEDFNDRNSTYFDDDDLKQRLNSNNIEE